MADRDWAAVFSRAFASPASAVQARIWSAVYGSEYPSGLDTYSFVTRSDLARLKRDLGVGRGEVLVDLGCGRGGPGLWITAHTGARLIGIDISDTAVVEARRRARAAGLSDRSEFRLGTFASTGLAPDSVDAIMSIDAFLFAPDKAAGATELARILRPGGRLVMTTWDYHRQPAGRPPQVSDHRPLLEQAGFDVLAYDESPAWRERQTVACELLLESAVELAQESGEDPETVRARLDEMRATVDCMRRHVFVVACRATARALNQPEADRSGL